MDIQEKRRRASSKVKEWQTDLKIKGGFSVEQQVLDAAKADFASERVSDEEIIATIREVHKWQTPGSKGYILDPHSAIGVTAALRSMKTVPDVHHIALATAHPAKFSNAVEMALKGEEGFHFKDILPQQFVGLEDLPQRIIHVQKSKGLEGIRRIIVDEVENQLNRTCSDPYSS